MLIGADYLRSFQAGITKRGKPREPNATETELGWVLSGHLKGKYVERSMILLSESW